jgi:hypothetical protein
MTPLTTQSELTARLTRRHLLIGWSGLVIFLLLGILLETMHGVKAAYYLDTRNVTRRLMWTLAHTHGTLFSLVHIAFAISLGRIAVSSDACLRLASRGMTGALLLMPAGFFLGGLKFHGGDPGVGVFLVPIGALLMLLGTGSFLWGLWRGRRRG